MTEAMPFLQKCDITFLRPPTIIPGLLFLDFPPANVATKACIWYNGDKISL